MGKPLFRTVTGTSSKGGIRTYAVLKKGQLKPEMFSFKAWKKRHRDSGGKSVTVSVLMQKRGFKKVRLGVFVVRKKTQKVAEIEGFSPITMLPPVQLIEDYIPSSYYADVRAAGRVGIGRIALAEAERRAKNMGAKYTWISRAEEGAEGFWDKMGYKPRKGSKGLWKTLR
ncbi:hypothetical protein HY546_02860 [archaeon]|nr:hypothetical protein [archaeon]